MSARWPWVTFIVLVCFYVALSYARAERFIVDGRVAIGPADVRHWYAHKPWHVHRRRG